MSWRERPSTPLLEPMDGPLLVELGNWLANSLDVSELSREQAVLLWVIVDRLADALWREFGDVLRAVAMHITARMDADLDDSDDPSEDPDDS